MAPAYALQVLSIHIGLVQKGCGPVGSGLGVRGVYASTGGALLAGILSVIFHLVLTIFSEQIFPLLFFQPLHYVAHLLCTRAVGDQQGIRRVYYHQVLDSQQGD